MGQNKSKKGDSLQSLKASKTRFPAHYPTRRRRSTYESPRLSDMEDGKGKDRRGSLGDVEDLGMPPKTYRLFSTRREIEQMNFKQLKRELENLGLSTDGNREVLKARLMDCEDVQFTTDEPELVVGRAAAPVHVQTRDEKLEEDEADADPFHMAARNGHVGAINLFINKKADLELKTTDGSTPLSLACQRGHKTIAKMLLQASANPNTRRRDGASPLHLACAAKKEGIAKALILHNAKTDALWKFGATPLIMAASNGMLVTVHMLLERFVKVDGRLQDGATAVYVAAENGHIHVIQKLLEKGAKINYNLKSGASPLYIASQNNHIEVCKILLDQKAWVNAQRVDGAGALYIASETGHTKICHLLLASGAAQAPLKQSRASPLYIAAQNGHAKTCSLLINCHADVDVRRSDGVTPLIIASANGHAGTVMLLLNCGAEVNIAQVDGASSLFVASEFGHLKCAELLIEAKAKLNQARSDLSTPLLAAVDNDHLEIASLLVRVRASINGSSALRTTPLMSACANGNEAMVKMLINFGGDPSYTNKNKNTALHEASKHGQLDVVRLLINKRVNVNAKRRDGATAVALATRGGYMHVAKLLVTARADIKGLEQKTWEPDSTMQESQVTESEYVDDNQSRGYKSGYQEAPADYENGDISSQPDTDSQAPERSSRIREMVVIDPGAKPVAYSNHGSPPEGKYSSWASPKHAPKANHAANGYVSPETAAEEYGRAPHPRLAARIAGDHVTSHGETDASHSPVHDRSRGQGPSVRNETENVPSSPGRANDQSMQESTPEARDRSFAMLRSFSKKDGSRASGVNTSTTNYDDLKSSTDLTRTTNYDDLTNSGFTRSASQTRRSPHVSISKNVRSIAMLRNNTEYTSPTDSKAETNYEDFSSENNRNSEAVLRHNSQTKTTRSGSEVAPMTPANGDPKNLQSPAEGGQFGFTPAQIQASSEKLRSQVQRGSLITAATIETDVKEDPASYVAPYDPGEMQSEVSTSGDQEISISAGTTVPSTVIQKTSSRSSISTKKGKYDGYFSGGNDTLIKGRYKVENELGRGAYASVFEATDTKEGNVVAIKISRSKEVFTQHAKHEFMFCNMVQKPTPLEEIIDVIDGFEHDGHYCIVMPKYSKNLHELNISVKGRGVSLELVRMFGKQILVALNRLEEHKVLHRDLKPENVLMVSPDSARIKLVDFGSAASADEGSKQGDYVQSRYYRAPEVILGLQQTPAMDLWSVGCVLFEFHTGIPLFPGQSELQMIQRQVATLGMPPVDMIKEGRFSAKHFVASTNEEGSTVFNLQNERGRPVPEPRSNPLSKMLRGCARLNRGRQGHMHRDYENFQNILQKMLTMDPEERVSPSEALLHPFFQTSMEKKGYSLPPMWSNYDYVPRVNGRTADRKRSSVRVSILNENDVESPLTEDIWKPKSLRVKFRNRTDSSDSSASGVDSPSDNMNSPFDTEGELAARSVPAHSDASSHMELPLPLERKNTSQSTGTTATTTTTDSLDRAYAKTSRIFDSIAGKGTIPTKASTSSDGPTPSNSIRPSMVVSSGSSKSKPAPRRAYESNTVEFDYEDMSSSPEPAEGVRESELVSSVV